MTQHEAIDAGCKGKHRYPNGATAWQVANEQRRKRHTTLIQAYRCEHCGGWHVGSDSRGETK